ncbi:MAG: damage-inducible protein DinB [Bacteroidetes bacterium QH_2_63_10]|nr:MAG: damage-inducible protein DinB [Bacteroidetes bacterium QH_2_63_10]
MLGLHTGDRTAPDRPVMPAPQPRTTADFDRLFRYTRWANDRLLDTMQVANAPPDRAVELFSHLLRAQDMWYGRIEKTDHAALDLWADEDLAACAERAEASAQRWKTVLDERAANDLDQPIAYTNSKGTRFETPLRDLLSHIVNHGTHHRAQIALVLREAGIAPPATDYIFFVREE